MFPISSLGHTVLIPSWFGGTWAILVVRKQRRKPLPGVHRRPASGHGGGRATTPRPGASSAVSSSIFSRRIESADQKLAWLLVVATVPVGAAGLLLEHPFRELFAKPLAAAIFLTINGVILGGAEVLAAVRRPRGPQAYPSASR